MRSRTASARPVGQLGGRRLNGCDVEHAGPTLRPQVQTQGSRPVVVTHPVHGDDVSTRLPGLGI